MSAPYPWICPVCGHECRSVEGIRQHCRMTTDDVEKHREAATQDAVEFRNRFHPYSGKPLHFEEWEKAR